MDFFFQFLGVGKLMMKIAHEIYKQLTILYYQGQILNIPQNKMTQDVSNRPLALFYTSKRTGDTLV